MRLWAADGLSAIGDGFTLIAAPLLLTTLSDPATSHLVSPARFARGDPAMRTASSLALARGRALRASAHRVRGHLATHLPAHHGRQLLLFASGVGDTFVLTAGTSLVPQLVGRHQLTRANSRIIGTRLLGALLLARPVGAWLFTRSHAAPFFVDAASFVAGAVLLFGLPTHRERARRALRCEPAAEGRPRHRVRHPTDARDHKLVAVVFVLAAPALRKDEVTLETTEQVASG